MNIFNENVPTRELFVFLRYNTIPQDGSELKLSESDEKLYDELVVKVKSLANQLNDGDMKAKANISAIFSMFGFSRHYCSMTGQPIVGKYYKIGSKVVGREAYEAHKIVQEIEKNYEVPTDYNGGIN